MVTDQCGQCTAAKTTDVVPAQIEAVQGALLASPQSLDDGDYTLSTMIIFVSSPYASVPI